ncbi:MAG: hypothetical protein AAB840_01200 [Patescibacteria group bacterium]
MDQLSPISPGGQEKPQVETGEKAPEIPTPPDVQEVSPEVPKEEVPKAEMPEIMIETPSEEAVEEKRPESAKEEIPDELKKDSLESIPNTVDQAFRIQEELNKSSQEA